MLKITQRFNQGDGFVQDIQKRFTGECEGGELKFQWRLSASIESLLLQYGWKYDNSIVWDC